MLVPDRDERPDPQIEHLSQDNMSLALVVSNSESTPRPPSPEKTANESKHQDHTFGPLIASESDRELWFADGNVVFRAQDTYFRVHSSMMKKHRAAHLGPVLQDGDGYRPYEFIHGCPVIQVDDSAHDFKHLLHIIYDGFDYFARARDAEFTDIASAARLSYKYDMVGILDEATRRMHSLFPDTLDEWDSDKNTSLRISMLRENDPIEAINLFRTLRWDDMLPAAFYLACQLPMTKLLHGVRRADGTLEKLSSADVERCIMLHRACVKASGAAHVAIFESGASSSCNLSWFSVCRKPLRDAGAIWKAEALHGEPLGKRLREMIETTEKWCNGRICAECFKESRKKEKGLRDEFWQSLPDKLQLK